MVAERPIFLDIFSSAGTIKALQMLSTLRLSLIPLLLASGCLHAEQITGKVISVADGDTVTLLDATKQQHKIRLSGIDAPEKAQPFGQRSKQYLSDLVYGREIVTECGKVDRYQRRVCKIMLNGRDVNLQQIEAGLAWWYRKYSAEQPSGDRLTYETAEIEARNNRRGLWRDTEPMPPWDWRKISRR